MLAPTTPPSARDRKIIHSELAIASRLKLTTEPATLSASTGLRPMLSLIQPSGKANTNWNPA